ncbi:MAG: DUF2723 domain-containing protein [Prevotella sp.]|nr:DUF2723 domain-containing protein [Prevotella sp.]
MMQQPTFSRINTCTAWLVFAIAATVYGLTIEPTASLWDCPEFIACGYKLEIGHPPGAPFFMLAANLFAQLASQPSQVAMMVNLLSALLSAGCIFFLFLTITHLAKRLTCPPGDALTLHQVVTIETCGLVGALAYTFSDTFWFSAVEAEVYAFSSFLTALMFWLILKWEEKTEERWLILIAYITGLSIGVHLLCLLCLPAMSFVVYFRRTERITLKGVVMTLTAGGLLVSLILYGLIPGVVKIGGWFELLFTNALGCPYNTGLVCYILLLAATLVVAYYKARRRLVRLSLACLLMLLAGYSSYGVIFIRANANPPMNENAPGNIFSLGSYLNREQYGKTPLLYGPAYCSEVERQVEGDYLVPVQKEGKAIYRPSADATKEQYEVIRHDIEYVYKSNMYFPRMHSQRHAKAYEDWLQGVRKQDGVPTAAENLRFFLTYQVNFMYWRYFLWNFVGRQNNIQGHGEAEHGNWITGFRWIDDWLLGCDTSKLPSDLKENRGRNVFYGLPLLLGLLGMVWQWRRGAKGRQQLLVVTLLFVMTGLAIVVYLNQTPLQPRERDYAYAGSFYAFAIWIGLGVQSLTPSPSRKGEGSGYFFRYMSALKAYTPLPHREGLEVGLLRALLCLLVPLQMASQTWDDHDRSGRYTCRDFGRNYLMTLQDEGSPIILTNGDNDTFPLWYNHEVEGVRRDTRDCNMEYLQTDWYIDQMKRPAYDSPALPISFSHEDYQEGRMEYTPIAADSITIGQTAISLKGVEGLYKNELTVLDVLANADWKRPVYISVNSGSDNLSFLRDHLVLEGLAYRVSPTATEQKVDVERLYDNIMHRFRYGGLSTEGIYVDEDVRRLANTHQMIMGVLIDSLLRQGDNERALDVCRKWQQEMPPQNVPYTESALAMARCFYVNSLPDQGDRIVSSLLRRAVEWLSWIDTIRPSRRAGSAFSRYTWLQTMELALAVAAQYDRNNIYQQYIKHYERYNQ